MWKSLQDVSVLSYAEVEKRVCSVLFLITTHRQTGGFRGDPLPQGLTSWEVLQYVAKTRLSVTHTSRHMHTHSENIYPNHYYKSSTYTLEYSESWYFYESQGCRLSGIFLINLLTSNSRFLLIITFSFLEQPHTFASCCTTCLFLSLYPFLSFSLSCMKSLSI